VALVRTDVSEELRASFIRVTRIDDLGTTLAVTNNRRMLRRNNKRGKKLVWNSELRMQRGATLRNIPEDAILQVPDWVQIMERCILFKDLLTIPR
jgi:hypothetical protein